MMNVLLANLPVEPSLRVRMNIVFLRVYSGTQLTTRAGSVHLEQSSVNHWFRLWRNNKFKQGVVLFNSNIITTGVAYFSSL